MGISSQGNSYEWSSSAVSGMQATQPLSIDTGINNARPVPTTPATTPPGNLQGMQQYSTSQGYDSSRQMYSAPPSQQGQYSTQTAAMPRYGSSVQTGVYPKTEMGPPATAGVDHDHSADTKPADSMMGPNDHGRVLGEVDEHEAENDYAHTNAAYAPTRSSYGYTPSAAVQAEHAHLSPEMTGSPHQNGSGGATPRTASTSQQWNTGYNTPQRAAQPPSTNLMHVMSTDPRANGPNGNTAQDAYVPPAYQSQSYPTTNGATSVKRARDDDDDQDYGRPAGGDTGDMGLKRQKTLQDGSVGANVGGSPYSQARASISQRRR
jgi:enhanced filamentous growth protein 1